MSFDPTAIVTFHGQRHEVLTVTFNQQTRCMDITLESGDKSASITLLPPPSEQDRSATASLYRLFKTFHTASVTTENYRSVSPISLPDALNGIKSQIDLDPKGMNHVSIQQSSGGTLILGIKEKGGNPITMTVWPVDKFNYPTQVQNSAHQNLVIGLGFMLRHHGA